MPETDLRSPMGTRHHRYDPDKMVQPHPEAPPVAMSEFDRFRRSAPAASHRRRNPTMRQLLGRTD